MSPALTPVRARQRATLGALHSHHGPDHPAVVAARRQFAVDRLADELAELGTRYRLTPDQATTLVRAVVAITGPGAPA